MPRPKRKPPEPVVCKPIAMKTLEKAMKAVLLSPKPDDQHSENRDPTLEELNQKFTLKRRA